MAFFCASNYGVGCSPVWLITAWLVASILAMSTPPIPGGAAIAYSMLLSQLGIPAGALAVILAVDLFSDFVITGNELLMRKFTIINAAAKLGLLDTEALRH